MKTKHCFPSQVTEHKVTIVDGTNFKLFVSPCETFGHALARMGIPPDSVASVGLDNAPMYYEPDFSSASR